MESYHGLILTPRDLMVLLEALRIGLIPKTQRRLSEYERGKLISNGAIFIWDERESGMKRWTDGKSWSASRVSGSFLIYKEMENTRNYPYFGHATLPAEENYRYKYNGLIKQSFSITLNNDLKLHLISYVSHSLLKLCQRQAAVPAAAQAAARSELRRPTEDPVFKGLKLDPSLYPETILSYQDLIPDYVGGGPGAGTSTGGSANVHRSSYTFGNAENSPAVGSSSPRTSATAGAAGATSATALATASATGITTPATSSATGSVSTSAPATYSYSPHQPPHLHLHLLPPLSPYYAQYHPAAPPPPPSSHNQYQLSGTFAGTLSAASAASAAAASPPPHAHQPPQFPQRRLNSNLANIPSHHREDGMYLSLLDRGFSS